MIASVMTIGELSFQTGVPSSTLRYWERMKVLPKPMRVSGQRRYSSDVADLVVVVKVAQSCGFSVPEVQRLIHGFQPGTTASSRWRAMARDHREILQEKIANLKAMSRLLRQVEQCQCPDLPACGRIAKDLLQSSPQTKRTIN